MSGSANFSSLALSSDMRSSSIDKKRDTLRVDIIFEGSNRGLQCGSIIMEKYSDCDNLSERANERMKKQLAYVYRRSRNHLF